MTGTWIIEWERAWRGVLRRHRATLWGQGYLIKPVLVSEVFGDGGQVIGFEPMDSRPDYYVVRVDSRWHTHNCARTPEHVCDHLGEISDAIVNEFGRGRDEWEHENGRTYVKHWPFPALYDGTGCSCWWQIATLLNLSGED